MSIKEKCVQFKDNAKTKLNAAIEKLLVNADGEVTKSGTKLLLALPLKLVLKTISLMEFTQRKVIPYLASKCLKKENQQSL